MAKRYGAARVSIAGGALLAMLAGVDYLRAESSAGIEAENVQDEATAGTAAPELVTGSAIVEAPSQATEAIRTAPRVAATATPAARTSRGS